MLYVLLLIIAGLPLAIAIREYSYGRSPYKVFILWWNGWRIRMVNEEENRHAVESTYKFSLPGGEWQSLDEAYAEEIRNQAELKDQHL